jgi:cellulose synthase/poly-beta-1,6-N-acetylglucosamine synthase-like glycosyltransferase
MLASGLLALAFGAALAVALYAYLGYPLLLAWLARRRSRPVAGRSWTPRLSLLIPAYNEAAVIAAKLENSLALDYPGHRLEILVGSDGSGDGTEVLARAFETRGVRVLAFPARRGKAAVLNDLVAAAEGEILVFTDANVLCAPDALRALVRPLADPAVGGVSGDVVLVNDHAGWAKGETLYYWVERFIQDRESRLGSAVGADGGLYAIRRALFVPLDPRAVLDDFIVSMRVALQGFRVIYAPGARGFERTAVCLADEFRRRKRVAGGIWQALVRGWGIPRPAHGFLFFAFCSHKLARWAAAFGLVLLLGSSGLLAGTEGGAWRLVFGAQLGLYGVTLLGAWAAARGRRLPAWLRVSLYFVLSNTASVAGVCHAAVRPESVLWAKGRRHPGAPEAAPAGGR